ncbi:ABC transporter type 1, transmembrane domain-containing protein [Boletus reticuloceps]|uniref:ABC transporter type 1, transmembrane domain-containing protein n=1 Tax=Boletus reticuloceps TaxID=495285 RepID=A0A8I3A5Z1_9AGAM|nr:ABC transporter type 1, transmembrane domain-containing protein [Boletus reticuloceps]
MRRKMNELYRTIDLLPSIFVMGSFLILLVSAICTKRRAKSAGRGPNCTGPLPLYFKVARVVASILLSLTVAIAWYRQDTRPPGSRAIGGVLYITVGYGVLLTLLSVSGLDFGNSQLIGHVDLVWFGAFGVIAHRDLWPWFTFAGLTHQLDLYSVVEDALLGILGIIIPLTCPREYRPVNDTHPLGDPHPEQTASWLSLLLYSWLNPLISVAYTSKHLTADTLPPLADYDHVAEIVSRNTLHLEPREIHRTRVFFGLMTVFLSEYVMVVFLVLIQVALQLASPFALGQFLGYLETQGKGATIRPIVWILLLSLSPIMYSISYQWSTFILTRVAVHAEVLLSNLIFKHALRIRLQGDGSNDISLDGNNANSQANFIGTINNHVTTDLTSITEAKNFLPTMVGVPVQIILCIAFLHGILGWSSLVGAAAMVILFPVPGYIGGRFQSVEAEKMKQTDARVQLVSEIMNVLRMIKLFGWERKISSEIQNKRVEELSWTRKRAFLQLLNDMVNFAIPTIVMLITYSTYTLVARQNLTASIVYSSISVFDLLHQQISMVAESIPCFIRGKVALDRINSFLLHDDVVSELPGPERSISHTGSEGDNNIPFDAIGISHAAFSWTKSERSTQTPQSKYFTLSVHDELIFKHKELNLVTGPTGSGKTSLLMALLGEMYFHPSAPSSWCNLPRHLGVAYAAQESWILNRTIRDNILFHSEFDEERYTSVLLQCALKPDLALMEHGDLTEVGERGVTLSGGQKARITLARAIYSSAQVLLLDDVFAALDVQTSQWIVDHCFRGKLVKGRTIIMTTHNISLVKDIARYVVILDNEGQVQSHGRLKPGDGRDTKITGTDQIRKLEVDGSSSDNTSPLGNIIPLVGVEGGTLTTAEEIAEGHVSWSAVLLYLLGWGGRAPVLYWCLFVFGMSATHASRVVQNWYLGYWAEQYRESSMVNVGYNITIYTSILCCTVTLYSLSYTVNLVGSLRACKTIHDRLIEKIFGATFRWLDTTPVARVITRCTQDIGAVDGAFSVHLAILVELTIAMLVSLAAVVYLAPLFILPGLIIAIIGGWCGQMYMKAELSVKRELSNAKAPMLAHLSAILAGLVSIRAFGAQSMFIKEYHSSIDHYTKVARTFHALNCWVAVRLEALGASFTAALAAYLMYGNHNINPSNVGFSLNMAVFFSGLVLWWIIKYNDTEINANSLERIASYMDIEQEEVKSISKCTPPAYWPASGDLQVENLSARYSVGGPNVLHNLTFRARAESESGLSVVLERQGDWAVYSLPCCCAEYTYRDANRPRSRSLSCAAFSTEGNVYYDGILTSSIKLEDLRSSVTIIPQSVGFPTISIFLNKKYRQSSIRLINSTTRLSTTPFDLRVLSQLRLPASASDDSENSNSRLTLDTPVTARGANLSVGQRQIVALARAMVRESKLLVLDEDHETDAVIQRTLREMKWVTQLIIAHRLQSVMDTDRIMVLDAGRIVSKAQEQIARSC